MGRGRQRAKQAKVARELKYQQMSTDLEALQRELSSARQPHPEPAAQDADETDDGGSGADDPD